MAWKIVLAVVVLFILITVYSVVLANRCIKQMDNSKKIVKGMDENEVLNLQERMIPFSSTFNTSGNDIQKSAGRPTNEESGKIDSDETARSRDKSSTVIDW